MQFLFTRKRDPLYYIRKTRRVAPAIYDSQSDSQRPHTLPGFLTLLPRSCGKVMLPSGRLVQQLPSMIPSLIHNVPIQSSGTLCYGMKMAEFKQESISIGPRIGWICIVKLWTRVLPRSNFLHFDTVFGEIWPNNKFAPPSWGWCPPSEKSWICPCQPYIYML